MSLTVSNPPRIAYLTGEYPTVSHTFILREVEALRQLGLEVETCSVRQTGAEHHRGPAEKDAAQTTFYILAAARRPAVLIRAAGVALSHPGRFLKALTLAWRTRQPGLKGTLWQFFYLIEALILAQHLKRRGIGHLHNHFGNSSCSVAMLTSEVSGMPFSYTMHGPSIFFEPRLWRIDEKIARAKFVSCISHFCRSQGMIFADPTDWSQMRIIHCGIDPDRYDAGARATGRKRLLFVGRLAAVKGVLVLLSAFAKVRKNHPDAVLTLVGDGPERANIEAYCKELELNDAVRFTGYLSQTEVAGALQNADLFVLPSFAEGVPVVLMEAMASRLPVVATSIAGVPELIETGKTGLLVPPGDTEALAEAISSVLADDTLCRTMGEAGCARVRADFNQLTEATRLAALFTDTAASGIRFDPPSG
ncbi:MAG: glycosyltransferase family 4 protein [Pseudomonadota bacterium]